MLPKKHLNIIFGNYLAKLRSINIYFHYMRTNRSQHCPVGSTLRSFDEQLRNLVMIPGKVKRISPLHIVQTGSMNCLAFSHKWLCA